MLNTKNVLRGSRAIKYALFCSIDLSLLTNWSVFLQNASRNPIREWLPGGSAETDRICLGRRAGGRVPVLPGWGGREQRGPQNLTEYVGYGI